MLVDSGTQSSPNEVIFPFFESHKNYRDQPVMVVNTHCHCDHIGGNSGLQSAFGAMIAAHRDDVAWIEDRALQFTALFGPFSAVEDLAMPRNVFDQLAGQDTRVDQVLLDGDRIRLGNFEFQVIHTPGHTPGSIALYEGSLGILLTGDSVQGGGTAETGVPLIADLPAYQSSLQRLDALDISWLVAAHPFKPYPIAIFDGQAAHEFLCESMAVANDFSMRVANLLEAVGKPITLLELSQRLSDSQLMQRNNLYNVILTAACLDELASFGQALRLSGSGWQPEGVFIHNG